MLFVPTTWRDFVYRFRGLSVLEDCVLSLFRVWHLFLSTVYARLCVDLVFFLAFYCQSYDGDYGVPYECPGVNTVHSGAPTVIVGVNGGSCRVSGGNSATNSPPRPNYDIVRVAGVASVLSLPYCSPAGLGFFTGVFSSRVVFWCTPVYITPGFQGVIFIFRSFRGPRR